MLPYGIRSVWSRPIFTSEGKALGTFSLNYREPRSPGANDVQLIENASHITGIAIERHMKEEALRRERDRLRLLLVQSPISRCCPLRASERSSGQIHAIKSRSEE